ncbi:MAG TPA: DUF3617 domain-containing protein [Steroidobacteraceae bacterium]
MDIRLGMILSGVIEKGREYKLHGAQVGSFWAPVPNDVVLQAAAVQRNTRCFRGKVTMRKLLGGAMGLAICSLRLAATNAADVALNVKTGLWQSTITVQTSGQLPIPEADLAKMSPEQRQHIEAAMKAAVASAAQPHTVASCVTAEQLRKGLLFKTEDASCKRTIVSSSSSASEMHEECTGALARTSTIHFHAISPKEIDGQMHMTVTRDDRTMTSKGTIHSKWLAADCGDVKPGHPAVNAPAQ